jgi:hypothetical protein
LRPTEAGLEGEEEVLTATLTSTDTTERNAGMLLHPLTDGGTGPNLWSPQRAGYGLREPVPVRRRRSRASFSDSEVMGCPTVC